MLDVAPSPRTHTPPEKSWRNYYRVYHVINLSLIGHVFPGIHPGPALFPSQEIAESRAHAFLKMLNPPGRYFMDHAGAFPEGDAAN